MTAIDSLTLEVADPAAADRLYTAAFGLGTQVRLRRGGTDDRLPWVHAVAHSVAASHRQRPHRRRRRRRSHGAEAGQEVVLGLRRRRASTGRHDLEGRDLGEEGHRSGHARDRPDRASAGSLGRAASRRFYVDRGRSAAKSFGRKYVEFATATSSIKLALYGRSALAKDVGVVPDGTGSHRLLTGSDSGRFTDPDGFAWAPAQV